MSVKTVVSAIAMTAIAAALPQPAAAQRQAQPQAQVQAPAPNQGSKTANGKPINQRNYEEVYANYLASARQLQVTPGAWMADLATDPSARRAGDLVTIRVIESLSATGSADSTINKASSADVKIPLPQSWMDMTLNRVLPFSAETSHTGSGGTTRTTQLSATMTARVTEVLPNGDMVVQGVREVNINGDRTLVVLSGVIRPNDVAQGNVVPSTRVGQLSISSLSQGLIKDSLTPGYLIRLLNKVF